MFLKVCADCPIPRFEPLCSNPDRLFIVNLIRLRNYRSCVWLWVPYWTTGNHGNFKKYWVGKYFIIYFLIFPNLDWVWRRTFCGLTGLLSKLTRKVTKSVQTSYQSTHNTKNRTDPLVIPKSSIRLSCIVVIFTEVNIGISTKTFI